MIELGVSDSSAFIGLGRIGRFDLLRDAFSRLVIPPAVAAEIGDVPSWAAIEPPVHPRHLALFPPFIHKGEAEVYPLGA